MINIMEKRLPVLCPSCDSQLRVSSMLCEHCDTTVTGFFQLPVLMRLDQKEQTFILEFVKSSGSLKIMAEKLKLSYPTVRNMLDDLIEKIVKMDEK